MNQKYIRGVCGILFCSILIACGGGGGGSSDSTPSTYSILGKVNGDIKQNVNIAVSGATNANALTDADGNYSVSGLPNGSYTVIPSKAGYTFAQASRSVVISGAASTGNDFTAVAVLYSISGTVSGDVTAGATITVAGTTEGGAAFGPVVKTTSGDGSYSIPGIANGVYTISPAKLGYLFNPANRSVTITAANFTGGNFTVSVNPVLAFRANGGTGTAGTGGYGGEFYAESYGSIKVLKSGTVDASFTAPTIPNPGAQAFTVNSDTLVPDTDDTPGALCQVSGGDGSLYIGDGDGTCGDSSDAKVTDLTVAAGVTLTLVDESSGLGSLLLANNLVVNGTIATDLTKDSGLYIEASLIDVEGTGKITASATAADFPGGEIDLGSYPNSTTNTIINRGTIEAKGDGSGPGGYIYFEPNDVVVNYGTIDVSGGAGGGSGGEFDVYVDHGNFYSSGTVRMNGGNGTDGGDTEAVSGYWNGYSCWIETACIDNAAGSGDIIISGTWEAKGGDGTSGNGGGGGNMVFETDGIGAVTLNASMSVEGGNGAGAGSMGGAAGQIDFASLLDPYGSGSYTDPTPGKISIAGNYDFRGGDGAQDGGNGGYLAINCENGVNASGVGSDVEFVGFSVITLNGGEGGQSGGPASDNAFELYTLSLDPNFAKSITNEADVQARGGNATLSGATGGMGGHVDWEAGPPADASTVLSNTGDVDVSGGRGDSGGDAGEIDMGAQHIDNSGSLTADGADGTSGNGGNGGYIVLTSDDATPTTNTGTLSVAGGSPGGSPGSTTIQ
jgi:Carboxypeptidase regulatory-like domain